MLDRTAGQGPLPDALVIGPLKSGTTWIADYLGDRGDVCQPAGVKETFFFDRHHDLGADWYAAHFRHYDPAQHRRRIEVAPTYLHQPDVAERVRDLLGPVPCLVMLRDPAERAWSHYLHMRRKGYTTGDLRAAVAEYPSILDASRCSAHLAHWRAALGEAQVTALSFDQLAADPEGFARALAAALGLPPLAPSGARKGASNAAGVARSFVAARLARRASELLRRNRFHGLVNLGKRAGVARLVYGGDRAQKTPDLVMAEDDRHWLEAALAEEYAARGADPTLAPVQNADAQPG